MLQRPLANPSVWSLSND